MSLPSEIHRKVSRIENLATLPNIAAEILDMLRSATSSMKGIARVIEKDPSVTTKIIKVSNSPLWGFPGRVDNVQRALVLLGLKQVTNIVIAVSLYSTFAKLKANPYFDREKFWLHSAGTGQIARTFSNKLGLNFHGEDFVAALIHDIGKMVLDQFFPDQFKHILSYAKETNKTILKVEGEVLGCNHADIGGWLLQHWNFPDSIFTAVTYHHQMQKAASFQNLRNVGHRIRRRHQEISAFHRSRLADSERFLSAAEADRYGKIRFRTGRGY
ncbi:MAG: HDOD domain-containing protein [Calditrichia bacterium]